MHFSTINPPICFHEAINRYINIYKDGLIINTTLDISIQKILEESFNEIMINNQRKFNENSKKRLGENKACLKMVNDMNIVIKND